MTIRSLLFLASSLLLPSTCLAVNFFDGARAPKGMYFLTYTSFYFADKTTDSEGDPAKKDYRYRKFEEMLRLCYYTPELVITAFAAAGDVHSGFYDTSSGGMGDIHLGAGYFLPLKETDILPMLFVKFPTAEYDSGKSVNYGTNQYDIKPTVYFYKQLGRFSIDAAAKYFFRLKNPANDTYPGNEVHLQWLFGWQFSKWCKAGPGVNWFKSARQKAGGIKINDTEREALSAGGDLYLRLPRLSVTLTYLYDLHTENTTKGDFIQIKTCYKF